MAVNSNELAKVKKVCHFKWQREVFLLNNWVLNVINLTSPWFKRIT